MENPQGEVLNCPCVPFFTPSMWPRGPGHDTVNTVSTVCRQRGRWVKMWKLVGILLPFYYITVECRRRTWLYLQRRVNAEKVRVPPVMKREGAMDSCH